MFAAPGVTRDLVGAWRSLVSAPDWGSGGRWFESSRPDHTFIPRGFRTRAPPTQAEAAQLPMTDRPVILLTNDDGVHARGLRALRTAVATLGHVIVVAPSREQSASSHSITIDRPLRHIEHEPDVHSIDGTPADCVYLALFERRFLPRKPDFVLSGINHGTNIGTSVFYSGTVAGAREAAMRGIPAMAFSADGAADFDVAARLAARLAERFMQLERPAGLAALLNVNFPKAIPLGVRVTRVGREVHEEHVIPRHDPSGREYFWIGGRVTEGTESDGTDAHAIALGYASVTPLALETTSPEHWSVAVEIAELDTVAEPVEGDTP
jgi:5'-nucleotidase